MGWRRIVALAVPLALFVFALGFIVGLEVRRGPDWRLELDAYVAAHRGATETITVEAVVQASHPRNFVPAMGRAVDDAGTERPFPPRALRCALLRRQRTTDRGTQGEGVRQVVFLAHHSDLLYHVAWVAYEGPVEPFGAEALSDLETIGCDLALEGD